MYTPINGIWINGALRREICRYNAVYDITSEYCHHKSKLSTIQYRLETFSSHFLIDVSIDNDIFDLFAEITGSGSRLAAQYLQLADFDVLRKPGCVSDRRP